MAPSSAAGEDASEINSRHRDVAMSLRLNGRVTPRSIAYTATQVCSNTGVTLFWLLSLTLSVQACLLIELCTGLEAGACRLPLPDFL
jgi:hypothetical protein